MADRYEEARMLLRLADRDNTAFQILVDHPEAPVGNTMFQAQQAVEKAIKAVLSATAIAFPPSHNLLHLAKLLDGTGVLLPVALADLNRLNPYAVAIRYDDTEINTMTKNEATAIVNVVLRWAAATIPTEP